jgi:hypothetical protein
MPTTYKIVQDKLRPVQTSDSVHSDQSNSRLTAEIETKRINFLVEFLNQEVIPVRGLIPDAMTQVMAILALPNSPAKTLRIIDDLELAAINVMMGNLSKTKLTTLILENLASETVEQIVSRLSGSKITTVEAIKLSNEAKIELRIGLATIGFKENEQGQFIKSPIAIPAKTKSTGSIGKLLTSKFSSQSDQSDENKQHSRKDLRRVKSNEDNSDREPLLEPTTAKTLSH